MDFVSNFAGVPTTAVMEAKPQIDYKPQVMKLTQNVSVLYEMK